MMIVHSSVFHRGVRIGEIVMDGQSINAFDVQNLPLGDDFSSRFDAVRTVLDSHIHGPIQPKWNRETSPHLMGSSVGYGQGGFWRGLA
ncbi:hypothetical protein PSQ90_07795 [Devosia rhodophyticola]|uniref:Uncharacterized protein n=1 Tax=Devosia rhodophyticola TaxID=3026423 RepID=A0ABY7Z0X9_9HYPH|nr:hypothetical protein [Devosia rhodophyticola]WDR07310.1 hypothetical protein PSQ90_07795 [Devosia rhodophyticola]